MANTRSGLMANLLAKPAVKNSVDVGRAGVYSVRARIALSGGEASGHIFPLARFKATDRMLAIYLGRDDLATTAFSAHLGLYTAGDWTVADQAVIDVDAYADALDLSTTATTTPVAILGSGAGSVIDGDQFARQLWEDAGAASEPTPGTEYDVCLTGATITAPIAAAAATFIFLYASQY